MTIPILNGNGRARMNQWMLALFGILSVAFLGWVTWVTISTADYVSGEKRGERATMTQFRLELAIELSRAITASETKQSNDQFGYRQGLDQRIQKLVELVEKIIDLDLNLANDTKMQNALMKDFISRKEKP